MYAVAEVIGIELETSFGIPTRGFPLAQYTRDASVETPAYMPAPTSSIWFANRPDVLRTSSATIGAEYVSEPLDITDASLWLQRMTDYLESRGAREVEERAGIHFHVSAPLGLRFMHSLGNLWTRYEAALIYAASSGYRFRGETNDAAYCRTWSRPPIVTTASGKKVPIFHWEDCLNTSTTKEFFLRWGDICVRNPVDKHQAAARYTNLTFYPLVTKGTVEFRLFNSTLRPDLLKAYSELVVKLVDFSMHNMFSYEGGPDVYDVKKESLETDLDALCATIGMSPAGRRELELSFSRAPQLAMRDGLFYSHLVGKQLLPPLYTGEYCPPVVTGAVSNPKVVDIHALRNEG